MTSAGGETLFREVTGIDPDGFPLIAERMAIDAINALRAADSGLRGLRGRLLLRRLWDGVTGRGQELGSAIGQDLIAVQRATLRIVREVMREEMRTQYCVNVVLESLRAVHDDLDAVTARAEQLEGDMRQRQRELYEALRAESSKLAARIEDVRREARRDAVVRRLTERYRARDLHRGAGETLGAGMFLAAVTFQYWGADRRRREEEARAALAVVTKRLPARPLPLEDAVLGAVMDASDEVTEPLAYLGLDRGPYLSVLGALTERRMARLPISEASAAETIAVVRATRDPSRLLESPLIRPVELAQAIAWELLPDREETGPWRRASKASL
jgi:hypothetical protein